MFMLDTNICSYIMKMHPVAALEKFEAAEESHTPLVVSIIVYAELLYGVEKASSKRVNSHSLSAFMERLKILDWDAGAAKEYAKLRHYLTSKGKPIGNMDMMIAAHALSQRAVLVTNNARHFNPVPKLKTINWV